MVEGEDRTTEEGELSQEDYESISTIVLGWFLLWNLLMKLTPQDYAEKVFLKIGKSKKKPVVIRLLFDLIREKSNSVKSPDEFNQKLAKEMLDKSVDDLAKDTRLQHGNQKYAQRYLSSPRMSEILHYLKDRRILKHIPGKLAIQKEMHRTPGRVRGDSSESFAERFGGKPSAYIKTNWMDGQAILLGKPQARNLVYEALREVNILYDCERFMLTAFFLALKMRKHKGVFLVHKIIKATNSSPVEDWKTESMLEQIESLDEYQIKQFAADRAKESIKRRKDDAFFLMGLFKL